MSQLEAIWDRLLSAKNITIISHTKPDGDTLGSAAALYYRLKKLHKEVHLFNADFPLFPLELSFLTQALPFKTTLSEESDLWIFVDCANFERSGIPQEAKRAWILNIDHHENNTGFGDCNLLDSSKVSTGLLLHTLLEHQAPLTPQEAEAIYTTILTDGNYFKNDRIDASVFREVARLIKDGVEIHKINNALARREPLEKLRLLERLLSRIELSHDARIATSYLTHADFIELHAGVHMLEGLADYLLSVATVRVGIFAYEAKPHLFKVSLRSEAPHAFCHHVATEYGGGGHPHAAGYTSPCPSLEGTLQAIILSCKERLP